MNKLTDKQQAFVANKQAGCTNRDAAIAAGYSVAAASSTADKLMAMPVIRKALKDAKPVPGATVVLRGKYKDSMALLMDAMNCEQLPIGLRMDCAKALLPYQHARMGEKGKKETAKDRAREIAGSKRGSFAPKQPPQLHVVPK